MIRKHTREIRLTTTAATLAAGLACSAAVAAPSASSPSLKVSDRSVAYGETIVLSGASKGSAKVHLLAQPCGFTAPADTQQVAPKKGVFSFKLEPAITTIFRVTAGTGKSAKVRVLVKPAIQLRRVAAGRYEVDISAGAGSFFVGKHAVLQKQSGKAWKKVARAKLRAASSQTDLTAVSSGMFRAHVPAGTKLRASISRGQTGKCYGAATSAPISS